MNQSQRQAIAWADAYLGNAALPTFTRAMTALADVTPYAESRTEDLDASRATEDPAFPGADVAMLAVERANQVLGLCPDLSEPINPPHHLMIGGNVYWAEALPNGVVYLMTIPVQGNGMPDWADPDEGYEVDPSTQGYAEILACLAATEGAA